MRIRPGTLLGGALAAAVALPAHAGGEWQFELTPYLWAQQINAEVGVRDQTVDADVKFKDLVDALDIALAALFVARKDDWVYWLQMDYAELSTDNLDDAPDRMTLDMTQLLTSAAVGRTFPFLVDNSSIDVLVGARYLHLKNELDFHNDLFSDRKGTQDIVDPTILVRPNVPLFPETFEGKLRFNPTMGIGGGGDSDLVYELQPQIQYTFETTALRIGYRKLHYKVDGHRGEFDGAFQGFLIGFGFLF
jgi:hypothetical protein